MGLLAKYRHFRPGKWFPALVLLMVFIFAGSNSLAQIDSRNQEKPTREQAQQGPDKKKKKRLKRKKTPRSQGKKAYSNRKQIRQNERGRAKKVDKSPKGDITGRKVKSKKTPRTTTARPQPDPYKKRRIRTERSRAGPPAPAVRTATKKGERARTGDISGQKRVRQRSVKSARRTNYPQPNPYIGRPVKTEKRRAKSNTRQLRSIRTVSRPTETRKQDRRVAPVTATAAPKLRTKRHVYRNHERTGGEKSTDKDIAGRKLRTKNTRSPRPSAGGIDYARINPYKNRPRQQEGERFKRVKSVPASARTATRPPEGAKSYKGSDIYATRKNFRTPRTIGVVKAKSVRSVSQPSGRGEKPIFGKRKYRPRPTRTVSGVSPYSKQRRPMPPGSISARRKQYRQKNTYRGKDRHFGENATTKDIAGRRLRTRNYRSGKPNNATGGFMPYYGRSAPQGQPKTYATKGGRRVQRAGWNNAGQPIKGRGRNPNDQAVANYQGKMPLAALPGFGKGKEGTYKGNIPAKRLRRYGPGKASVYAGKRKAMRPVKGGGSITRGWNNGGMPILGRDRGPNDEAIAAYRGKTPLSAVPGYGPAKTGTYSGNIPARKLRKYGPGRESTYAGNRKARKPLKGGGSITRGWNNGGVPIMGRGRKANDEAIARYQGKRPLSSMPGYGPGKAGTYSGNIPARKLRKYGPGRESTYAGNMKAQKPLKGGGSITRGWNNGGMPIMGRGRKANDEAIAGYQGKMPLSAVPGYGPSKAGTYSGNIPARKLRKYGPGKGSNYAGNMKARKPLKGGGSITRHWNNQGQPLPSKGRTPANEAIAAYQGKMPLSTMPSYGKGKEGTYAGNIKAKKPLKGGGSITRHWNNKGQPIATRGRTPANEAIANYQGKLPLSAMPSYGRGKEGAYQGNMKVAKTGKKYHTEKFIGGNAKVRPKELGQAPGMTYGSRKKFLFAYFGVEGGYMPAVEQIRKNKAVVSPRVKQTRYGQSPGTENGRTRSLTFLRTGNPTRGGLHEETAKLSRNNKLPKDLRGTDKLRVAASPGTQRGRTRSLSFWALGNPTHGGLHEEVHNTRKNRHLPDELSGKERYRIKGSPGLDNGRSATFSFWALGNPTKGGLVYSPSQAKGRLHPSSTYTKGGRSRNAVREKEQPVKLKIWWAKLFKKNANQPDAVKEKTRRPRYDKGEREIWNTLDRPNWYNN